MARLLITGLDLGTATLRLAVCRPGSGKKPPEVVALIKKSTRGLRRGYVINFDEAVETVQEALLEAEKAAGTKIRRVWLGLGGVTLESRLAEGGIAIVSGTGEIGARDIERAVTESEKALPEMANKYILHRIPISFKLDGERILGRPEGLKGNKLEARVLFVLTAQQHLKDLIAVVEAAGAKVEDVVAAPLVAALVVLSKQQKAVGCVLVNIGSHTTSIVVFEEGLPLALKVFPIGSTDITNDIALGFKIPLEDAERLKRGEHDPTTKRKKLDEIIAARLSDIFELVEAHLKKIGRSGLLPAGIVITGGGSNLSHIEVLAKDYFRLPARLGSEPKLKSVDATWSVAYGLCLFGADASVAEESLGSNFVKHTSKSLLAWLSELIP